MAARRKHAKKKAHKRKRNPASVPAKVTRSANPAPAKRKSNPRRKSNPAPAAKRKSNPPARASNPRAHHHRRRPRRRRNGSTWAPALIAGAVGLAVGIGGSMLLGEAVKRGVSAPVIGGALAGGGIIGGHFLGQSHPAAGAAVAALGVGLGAPILAGSLLGPKPQQQTSSTRSLGAVEENIRAIEANLDAVDLAAIEQNVGYAGDDDDDDDLDAPVPSSASLGMFG